MVTKNEIRDWVIYKITSPSGRVYIGKTTNFSYRQSFYRNKNCKQQPLIRKSLVKYGYEAHKVEIIDQFKSGNDFSSGKEMFWIRSYMSNVSKWPEQRGLNLTDGGQGGVGKKMSDENRKKRSEYMKANPRKVGTWKPAAEQIERFKQTWAKRKALGLIGGSPMKGKKHTAEALKKMSEAAKKQIHKRGWKKTGQALENLREAAKKKTWKKPGGYKMKPEHLLKHIEVFTLSKGKPVCQYNLDGTFLKEYPSLSGAARETGLAKSTINNILNRTKNPRSFIFKYKQ